MTTCCELHGMRDGCNQGDDCPLGSTETAIERRARAALPDLVLARMLDEGTIVGPYRPTRPLLQSALSRFGRALLRAYTNR